jgi:hypothetical protein
VLGDVGAQEGVEAAGTGVRRGKKVRREQNLEAARARNGDGVGVVIHAHPLASEMVEIASESAPNIEDETQIEGLQVASVGALHVKQALPPNGLHAAET